MKYLRTRAMILSGICMLQIMSTLDAKYYRVRNENRFECALDNHDLVVVLFYNKQMAQSSIKLAFKQLSRGDSYAAAEVAFVIVDTAREDGADIARAYGVKKTPALMLFNDGRLLTGRDRAPLVLTDVKSVSDMRIFINTYFGDRIEDIVRDQEIIDREARRSRRVRRSGFAFGISYGYPYYPYYGYPFGYSYGYPIYMGW